MLLHVVESPLPVNGSTDRSNRQLTIGHVHDGAVLSLEDIRYCRIAETPRIMGLAARCRIKRASVQSNPPVVSCTLPALDPRFLAGNHLRFKIAQKRVIVIKPFAQEVIPPKFTFRI